MIQQVIIATLLACSIEEQLAIIRPGAVYQIKSGDYAGIIWLDKEQSKPTEEEMEQALVDCQKAVQDSTKDPIKDQAVIDAKDVRLSPEERINALIKALAL